MKKGSVLAVHVCLIYICLLTTTAAETGEEPEISNAAKEYGYFSSQNWCADDTTIAFDENRWGGSGLRFIFEPSFGTLFQTGENEFDETKFPNLSKFALETNVYEGWAAFQLGVVSPSTIKFDPISEAADHLADPMNKDVKVTGGVTLGASLIDGWISVGWGRLWYKKSSLC